MSCFFKISKTAVLGFFLSGAHAVADEVIETFDFDGEAVIECGCIPTGSFCGTRLQEIATEGERQTWTQTVYFRSGKQVNLSRACWRKRDASGMGDGLCCEARKDERDARWYDADILSTTPN